MALRLITKQGDREDITSTLLLSEGDRIVFTDIETGKRILLAVTKADSSGITLVPLRVTE